jgi:hypothetical protein
MPSEAIATAKLASVVERGQVFGWKDELIQDLVWRS